MYSERLTISCDECIMAGSEACADCVVSFIVGGTVSAVPDVRAPAAPTPGSVAVPSPVPLVVGPARRPSPGDRAPVPVDPDGRTPVLRLSDAQQGALRALAGAGLVAELRFAPRAAG